jgi:C2 domain
MDQSSDPFVAIAFEDTMVRTKVLFKTLSPRWMPWSTRAFAFNITHPGSLCYLGVLDYDEDLAVATDYHDFIGRVVLNTINFESGLTYVLQYDLSDSSQIDTVRTTADIIPS